MLPACALPMIQHLGNSQHMSGAKPAHTLVSQGPRATHHCYCPPMKAAGITALWAGMLIFCLIIVLLAMQARYLWCHTAALCDGGGRAPVVLGYPLPSYNGPPSAAPWASHLTVVVFGDSWAAGRATLNSILTQSVLPAQIIVVVPHQLRRPRWWKTKSTTRVSLYTPEREGKATPAPSTSPSPTSPSAPSLHEVLTTYPELQGSLVYLVHMGAVLDERVLEQVWRGHHGAPHAALGIRGASLPHSLRWNDVVWERAHRHMKRVGLLTVSSGIALRPEWLAPLSAWTSKTCTDSVLNVDTALNASLAQSRLPRALVSTPPNDADASGARFRRLLTPHKRVSDPPMIRFRAQWEFEGLV